MRLTLLCNCEWRFRNFNIDHPEQKGNSETYLELKERIEVLKDPAVAARVQNVVDTVACASRPRGRSRTFALVGIAAMAAATVSWCRK